MKLPCTPVISESCPELIDFVELCGSQGLDVRETKQKLLEVRDYSRDLGLLQHALADPNVVRIARASPRKIAMFRAVPCNRLLTDRVECFAWFFSEWLFRHSHIRL